MSESDVLAPFCECIALAHDRLGHKYGWRFLYTPASTLAPGTPMAFISMNPGDDEHHEPIRSVEGGNAYRDDMEPWWPEEQKRGLRSQVQRFFGALAKALGTSADGLMDETLTFNFCPFRSPDVKRLHNKAESMKFSQSMCARVLDVVEPPVIVCNGKDVAKRLDPVLRARGTVTEASVSYPTGWGDYTYTVTRYTTTRGVKVTMVGLLHLSRFSIFGRPKYRQATTEIVDTISAALRSSNNHT
jgi:hypothetical protein